MDQPSPFPVVSHYRVVRRLGAGGMGEVYLADDLTLERQVAIKFLATASSLDERARKRLRREAQAVAALDHPGICAVHEVGTTPDGRDFIVMQYAEGETLAARLARGRMPPLEALACCAQIAQALAAAHHHGIVHRDLKPQNVVVGPDGRVKLLDFGIATSMAAAGGGSHAATQTQLTEPHVLLGTAPYMSPEQVEHRAVDGRSDLFSLGAVLYECLTGRRAFGGRSTVEICMQVLTADPPPVTSIVSGLTAPHDALCGRLLAKVPDARFQSAQEFLAAVHVIAPMTGTASSCTPPAPSPRLRRRALQWLGAAAVLVLVAAMVVAWRWQAVAQVPQPPPDAQQWYERGVAKLRNGAYASARTAFEEAIRLFPQHVHAYARLAEACAELDDDRAAQAALLQAARLTPDQARLDEEPRLRIDALRATVLRDHEPAIASYRALVDRAPGDASRWLDLGRAEEAAWRLSSARERYEKARTLDPQYAPAHLRLGILASHDADRARALAAFDEAARLYRLDADAEGEAQTLLHRGIALNGAGDLAGARAALERVREIAAAQHLPAQRLRATFELASVTSSDGKFAEAARIAGEGVTEATIAGFHGLAANGLIDLAEALKLARQYEAAEAHLERAIAIAEDRSATRTAMRARLVVASIREQQGRSDDAIAAAAAPLEFFERSRHLSYAAIARLILARAHEALEHYAEASALARQVLTLAESLGHEALAAEALENLAGQQSALGRLGEAHAVRERLEALHRKHADHSVLPYDLTNRAELLIRLGRGAEAEVLLAEVDRGIADGREGYIGRRRRLAFLRALRAATEHRLRETIRFAEAAMQLDRLPHDGTTVLGRALAEYARAHLGVGGMNLDALAGLPSQATSPVTRREVSYWASAALLARGRMSAVGQMVRTELREAASRANAELSWRLASVALAADSRAALDASDTMRALATEKQSLVVQELGPGAARYFARRDFATLASPRSTTTHQ